MGVVRMELAIDQDDPEYLDKVLEGLEEAAKLRMFNAGQFFNPYPKQLEFFTLGATKRERMLAAGNQLGKSEGGAFETACHLTGEYPDWWTGKRWDRPVRAWAAGVSGIAVRDIQQKKLCGPPGVESAFGTGMIPLSAFNDKPSLARGVTDAYDTIQVKHKAGGISTLSFKSYEQGREKFQGEPMDFVWLDEECPIDVYTECLARIAATNGMLFTTFTPLKGWTTLVMRFWREVSEDRGLVKMTIYDALHYTDEQRKQIIAGYPEHERQARSMGEPMVGEGRVFPFPDEMVSIPTLAHIPLHWKKLWGIDFGLNHPFAAVLILWDVDTDTIYVYHCIRLKDAMSINHAAAMKTIGANVPVAWPQDGHTRREHEGDLKSTALIYKKHGLRMLDHHATFPDGGNSTEAGILEMENRMTTGKLKVMAHLSEWFEEYRMYHREDGKLVKLNDDLMSATRVAIMAKRFAQPVALGGTRPKAPASAVAKDVDFDLS